MNAVDLKDRIISMRISNSDLSRLANEDGKTLSGWIAKLADNEFRRQRRLQNEWAAEQEAALEFS